MQKKIITGCRWSKTTVKERSVILHRIADLLEARLQEFAEHESEDQGML